MYSTNVTFVSGRVTARPAIPRVLELVSSGALHPDVVTTWVTTWNEAAEALGEPFTKLVMVPKKDEA